MTNMTMGDAEYVMLVLLVIAALVLASTVGHAWISRMG